MRFLNEIDPCLASSSSVNKRAKPSSRVAIWLMKDMSLKFVITPQMELLIANQSRKRKKTTDSSPTTYFVDQNVETIRSFHCVFELVCCSHIPHKHARRGKYRHVYKFRTGTESSLFSQLSLEQLTSS